MADAGGDGISRTGGAATSQQAVNATGVGDESRLPTGSSANWRVPVSIGPTRVAAVWEDCGVRACVLAGGGRARGRGRATSTEYGWARMECSGLSTNLYGRSMDLTFLGATRRAEKKEEEEDWKWWWWRLLAGMQWAIGQWGARERRSDYESPAREICC